MLPSIVVGNESSYLRLGKASRPLWTIY